MKKLPLFVLLLQLVTGVVKGQSLVSISPGTGEAGQSVSVTVTGEGTSFGAGTQVVLNLGTNLIMVSNISIVSATEITATLNIPSGASSGDYTLIVNNGFNIMQLPAAFSVTGGSGPAASVVSVSPDNGNKGETMLVTITGANTEFTASGTTIVSLVGPGLPIIATGTLAITDTKLTCLVTIPANAGAGLYSLVVSTSNNGILLKPLMFTVNGNANQAPGLTAVSPSKGKRGQTLNVTITGVNTEFAQSSDVIVAFYDSGSPINANFAFVTSNTEIIANITIPADAPFGSRELAVGTSNQGILTLADAFTVGNTNGETPQLVSVSPGYGSRGQTLDVTITGSNTSFAEASSSLQVAIYNQATAISPNYVNVLNDEEMIANFTIPVNFPGGMYTVGCFSDIDDVLELENSFSIITTGIPESAEVNQSVKVYPNPVKEMLVFETTSDVNRIVLMDLTGKQIEIPMSEVILPDEHTYSVRLDQYPLGKGIYILRVGTNKAILHQKFFIE